MYRIIKAETYTLLSKAYIHVSNSIGVGSSNGVRRPKSKDTKLKNKVLKNTNAKRSSAYVQIVLNSVRIDSNKRETKNLNEYSRVKRALFTSTVAAKSKNLRATSIVAKSRFSVAKAPIATNKAQILKIQTDNETEFKNDKLWSFYAKLGIVYHTSIARTPQQNGVVEHQNCTLVEVPRTMLIFSKSLEFLWAEAIATACFTQNRSILRTWYNKTPYEMIRGRKLSVYYSHVFGSFCYPINNRDDLGKIKPKADNGIFIRYSESSREDMIEIPSQQDLNNLFGPLYEEYYALSTSKVLDNFAANTLDVEDTPLPSSIIVEDRCSIK
nr:retrovirus-related Pol polyprotein from transposon TNT 1-94 [Tanacetum cinerariifolium]